MPFEQTSVYVLTGHAVISNRGLYVLTNVLIGDECRAQSCAGRTQGSIDDLVSRMNHSSS